jgi:hypothetical protein
MPRYKVHTYIFEAASDEGAVATMKFHSPETPTELIQDLLWRFYDGGWRRVWPHEDNKIKSLMPGAALKSYMALTTKCDYLAATNILRNVKAMYFERTKE